MKINTKSTNKQLCKQFETVLRKTFSLYVANYDYNVSLKLLFMHITQIIRSEIKTVSHDCDDD